MNRVSGILGLVAIVLLAGGFLFVTTRTPKTVGSTPQSSAQPSDSAPSPGVIDAPAATVVAVKPGDCPDPLTHLTSFDRVSETVDFLTKSSSAVLAGTILSIGPTQWNTPDGSKPTDMTMATSVRRMATIAVQGNGKGATDGSTVSVALPGGTIGCDTYRLSGFAEVNKGDSVVLFVEPVAGGRTANATDLGMATIGWLVGPNGKVTTPEDGDLTTASVLSKIPKN